MLVSTAAPLGTARNDGADATDSAQAAAARGLRTLAELGGTGAFAVVTAGDHAYLGVGPRLVVIDIATPASPSWVAELRLPATPRALAMDADILYVADDEAGVRIIDVARPDAPREVAVVTRQGDALDIAVSNHTLYVVGGALGLVAIDVADPRTPRVLSETAALGGSAIAVVDGFVYVGQWAAITIVDVQDPTQPRVVGELTTPVDPELAAIGDIFVQGGVAYAALTEIGLWMVDVHQPSQPTSLAILPILNGATEVRVTGAQAVVTDGYRNLYVIDARAPSHAVVMGGYELWKATALALQGDLIAVSNGFSSLHLVDIADPTHPALKGVYTDPAPGYVHDVDVVRGTLWLLDSSRLLAYDVRQPAAPRLLGELAVPGGARRISVDGVRVYVTAQRGMVS